MSLYQLTAWENQIVDAVFDNLLTPEEFDEAMEKARADFNGKCDGYGKIIIDF